MPTLPKSLRPWLIRLVVYGTVAWIAISGTVTWRLVQRERPPRIERVPEGYADLIKPLRLTASDGVEVGAWLREGQPGRPAVVLVHGNGGSRTQMLNTQLLLGDQGLTTLALTVRAHGDAGGERNDIGWGAQHDVLAAVQWLRAQRPERPVVVFGQSLGAAAAVFAATHPASGIAGLWLECPYRDLDTAVHARLAVYLPAPLRPIAWAGLRLWALALLPDFPLISPRDRMVEVPAQLPVVVLAGAEDALAPPEHAAPVLGQHPGRLVVFPTGGHLTLRAADEPKWREAWTEFLAQVAGVAKAG
jgi:pimeloyl-ACP methyl ester carboxylesterase